MQFNNSISAKKGTKNMTTLNLRKSIGRSPLRRGLLLIALALACFGLAPAPNAFAGPPAPDGGYPGGNTAEGTNALLSRTTGNQNTATGYQTLFSTTPGSLSVANGSQALYSNTTGSFNTATGFRTLYFNTTGSDNTGNGYEALASNTTGNYNTANGSGAL
jgi:hypothetical protein